MKLHKLIQRTAAAAVVSAMALSISMPALAYTWNLSNGQVKVYYQNGHQVVEGYCVESDSKPLSPTEDENPVIIGKGDQSDYALALDGTEGAVSVTLKDAEAKASTTALKADGDVSITLEGSNKVDGVSDGIGGNANLKLLGSGSLEVHGSNAIDVNNLTVGNGTDAPVVTAKASWNVLSLGSNGRLKVSPNAELTLQKEYSGTKAIVRTGSYENKFQPVDYTPAASDIEGVLTYKDENGNVESVQGTPAASYGITVTIYATAYEVTADNYNSIYQNESGKLSYDPAKNVLTGTGTLPGMTIKATNGVDVEFSNPNGGVAVDGALIIDGARNVTVSGENNNVDSAYGPIIRGRAEIDCTGDVLIENKGVGDVVGGGTGLKVTGAQDVTIRGKCETGTFTVWGNAEIDCNGNIEITSENGRAVTGKLTVTKAQNVTVSGNVEGYDEYYGSSVSFAEITCSGKVTIENKSAENSKAVGGAFSYTPDPVKAYEVKTGADAATATLTATSETGEAYTKNVETPYICITPDGWTDVVIPDDPVNPGSDADAAGGAVAAVLMGGAAVWGGYEVVTRVILHDLLPEGAAIPANRGQLALLVWNTAGQPEPVNTPAFADVADADTAKAAQWCVEQGYLEAKSEDSFNPDGWTPKFRVIETWNKAFPQQ